MRGLLIVLLEAVSAAVASPPQVTCSSSNSAELSGNVTLTCEFQANLEVLQITWQKKRGKNTQNMATCSEKYGTHITKQFKKHITVLESTPAKSSINIINLEKEDEACYNCLFNAYPNGAFTGEICLTDLKDQNSPPEDTEKFVFIQCSASGNKKFLITWNNEGQPVSREDIVNKTGNLITVTSTLKHTVSSLPADRRIICNITLGLPTEAEPEKAALSAKEPTPGNGNKDDRAIYDAQQEQPWVRYLIVCGVVSLGILIFILFYCKALKKTEAKTPKKQANVENGQVTPVSSVKKLIAWTSERLSPKLITENEPGPGSTMNEATPSDSDKRNTGETRQSSLKKRNARDSARKATAPKRLPF
ncbi:OX-2 membrane glycoprotein-like isoform X2 [Lithobates pipiens]